MVEEETKQLQNKRKKLISQQKQEERKKRDKRFYEKGAVFESIFNESKDFTKYEFYQLIIFQNIKETIKNQKIVEKRAPTHFAVKQYKKYKLAAGVIELRRTLNHYISEICTS